MGITKIFAFNNSVETALRLITLLNAGYPRAFDLERLIYFDYLTVHSGDVKNGIDSLHVAVPNRDGELLVRRNIIAEGLELLSNKGLAVKLFQGNDGIKFTATEASSPFIDSLDEDYSLELNKRAEWVIKTFGDFSINELKQKIIKIKN